MYIQYIYICISVHSNFMHKAIFGSARCKVHFDALVVCVAMKCSPLHLLCTAYDIIYIYTLHSCIDTLEILHVWRFRKLCLVVTSHFTNEWIQSAHRNTGHNHYVSLSLCVYLCVLVFGMMVILFIKH